MNRTLFLSPPRSSCAGSASATRPRPVTAADNVSLAVEPGTLIALTGASGSGKSTLLHLIGAIERPDAGTMSAAAPR